MTSKRYDFEADPASSSIAEESGPHEKRRAGVRRVSAQLGRRAR